MKKLLLKAGLILSSLIFVFGCNKEGDTLAENTKSLLSDSSEVILPYDKYFITNTKYSKQMGFLGACFDVPCEIRLIGNQSELYKTKWIILFDEKMGFYTVNHNTDSFADSLSGVSVPNILYLLTGASEIAPSTPLSLFASSIETGKADQQWKIIAAKDSGRFVGVMVNAYTNKILVPDSSMSIEGFISVGQREEYNPSVHVLTDKDKPWVWSFDKL